MIGSPTLAAAERGLGPLVAYLLVVSVLVLATLLNFYRSNLHHPVEHLQEALLRVQCGDLEGRVPVGSDDHIGVTFEQIRGRMAVTPAGRMAVKGKRLPVMVFAPAALTSDALLP